MSIVFRCECGRAYDLEDENAGRTIHCLNCKKAISVPVINQMPSTKRGFTLSDLAVVVGGILLAAAILWYIIGYRLFGAERRFPAGALFLSGVAFVVIHCLNSKKAVTVPVVRSSEKPSAALPTDIRAMPTTSRPGRDQGRDTVVGNEDRLESTAVDSAPLNQMPSTKREFTLSDRTVVVGGILMAAAFLWYFIGYRLFGAERYSPAVALLFGGVAFIVRNVAKDLLK
jgi:hypothetical protein